MKKIICWLKGHKRGFTKYKGNKCWQIKCRRCEYVLEYQSPMARLIGTEIRFGFDGK